MDDMLKIQLNINEPAIAMFLKHPSFIPDKVPLMELPLPFDLYIMLLDAVHLVNTKEHGGVRSYMDEVLRNIALNLSDIDALSYWQQQKLLAVLTTLAHCYRWNYLPPAPEEYMVKHMDFPDNLWKPLVYIADLLEHPYCGTHWSTTLMNFQWKGAKPGDAIDLDKVRYQDLSLAHSWVEPDFKLQLEQWVKVFVMTDIAGSLANKACLKILKAVGEDDDIEVASGLSQLYEGIGKITSVFNREVRSQKLNVEHWRNHIQPTFIWGLCSDDSGQPLEGASGLQVGCIQLIDLVLGLDMDSKMGQALMTSRKYFPKHARVLLQQLEPFRTQLKSYIRDKNDVTLTQSYNQCLDALESYRVSHRQRGKVYIKGDGSPKTITTTGLSIQSSDDAVLHFEADMNERIQEVTNSKRP